LINYFNFFNSLYFYVFILRALYVFIIRAERFHVYLYGVEFTIITDCNALVTRLIKQI